MLVQVYDCDGDEEILRGQCELSECFPDAPHDPDYLIALGDLEDEGQAVVGGGSAPTVLFIAII
jgi:hypothetical protein